MKQLLFTLAALSLTATAVQAQTPYPAMPAYPPVMLSPMPASAPAAWTPYGMQYYPMPYGYPMQVPAIPVPAAPAAAPQPAPTAPAAAPAPVAAPTPAAGTPQATNPWLQTMPSPTTGFSPFIMMTSTPKGPAKPYSMRRVIPQQEKIQMMQMMVPMMTGFMRMEMPDAMNYFARKYKAKPGLSFDDVRDSLFLRANQLNMKKVGENLMWKDFHVVLEDKDAPRIEVYSFCDIAVGRDLLKISPEFIVFLPCRVAVMEDANKDIWVLMLDWNMDWVAGYEKQLGLTDELVKGAISINQRMDEMLRAAANGDL